MFVTLLVFVLILGLLVFVHEFGHFWVAKRIGVKVHEFAFGFKPTLFSWKKGDTNYAINAIPLGGYVRLEGENSDTGKEGSFMAKPPGQRALVLVAGIVMNIILAWVLLTITYGIGSYSLSPTFANHPGITKERAVVIVDVRADSPASKAGLKVSDTVLMVNDEPIASPEELSNAIQRHPGEPTTLRIVRDNQEQTVTVTPRANPPQGEGSLGVGTGETVKVKTSWGRAPVVALKELGSEITTTVYYVGQFFRNLFVKQELSDDVSGIVGIGAATGIVRRLGIGPLMQFVALISTNLAVVNILPILPLDGGHLLFTIIEAVRKKPVPDKYRQSVAAVGLVAILLLFVVVTYKDILRFSVFERITNLF
jgi:regulator of sigma E protease